MSQPLIASSDLAVSALSTQVVQLTALVSEMRSRMDNPCDSLIFGRPPPPPSSPPFSATPPSSFPLFTFTPTPSVGVPTHAQSLPPFTSEAYQTLGMSQPISMPSFGFHDSGGVIPATTRGAQQYSQPWHSNQPEQRSSDRLVVSRRIRWVSRHAGGRQGR